VNGCGTIIRSLEYSYDDENRLTLLTAYTTHDSGCAQCEEVPLWQTEFAYDGLGRLRIRTEYTWMQADPMSGWQLASTTWYIYDGMRVIQERNIANTPTVSYTRGLDLSGSLEGAGGIGGLLARSDGYVSANGHWTNHNYYYADGNGNISVMTDIYQGIVATYRYDPFGNTISQSGPLADANVYRFSSKEIHPNSGMYYYLYRFYYPNLQRWINRDPVGEAWGINLFQFVLNDPVSHLDAFGLRGVAVPASPNVDTCTSSERSDIVTAMGQACSQLYVPCSDPDCMNVIADAAQACKKKPKVQCAKPGDKLCADYCAYASGNVITLCPASSWPITGQNCLGNGGPMTLNCILLHELQHVGAGGKNPDDANTLQKCLGCPYGQPHKKK